MKDKVMTILIFIMAVIVYLAIGWFVVDELKKTGFSDLCLFPFRHILIVAWPLAALILLQVKAE